MNTIVYYYYEILYFYNGAFVYLFCTDSGKLNISKYINQRVTATVNKKCQRVSNLTCILLCLNSYTDFISLFTLN